MKKSYNVGNKKGLKVGNTSNWQLGRKINLFKVFKMISKKMVFQERWLASELNASKQEEEWWKIFEE
jgi:hypothetical protein